MEDTCCKCGAVAEIGTHVMHDGEWLSLSWCEKHYLLEFRR